MVHKLSTRLILPTRIKIAMSHKTKVSECYLSITDIYIVRMVS